MVLIILYESVECMKDVLEFGDSFIAKKLPPSNLNKKSSIKFQLKLTSFPTILPYQVPPQANEG